MLGQSRECAAEATEPSTGVDEYAVSTANEKRIDMIGSRDDSAGGRAGDMDGADMAEAKGKLWHCGGCTAGQGEPSLGLTGKINTFSKQEKYPKTGKSQKSLQIHSKSL